ncbi:MAG: hypothetical protein N2043_01730 [Ignavibacterium sp.]|nr:hypothetical protein [Ignavibacterium sp.]
MSKQKGQTPEQTIQHTKDTLGSLLYAMRAYLIQSGLTEEEASLQSLKAGWEVLNEFSDKTVNKHLPKPTSNWIEQYDKLLKELKSQTKYYPIYQKLLVLRKKIKRSVLHEDGKNKH